MGLRFFKRISIVPGISLNLSKSGPSLSFGPKGLKYTVGGKGTRTTFGLPGTGLYYTTSKSWKNNKSVLTAPSVNTSTSGGFFQKIFTSSEEKYFAKGMQFMSAGKLHEAIKEFELSSCTDGDFMCGYISLGFGNYTTSEKHLIKCKNSIDKLGCVINKVQKDFELLLELTDNIEAPIQLDKRGLTLSLVEAYQHQGRYEEAFSILSEIWNENPSDSVICLSLVDLVAMDKKSSLNDLKDVVELTKAMENDDPIDTNILYLRAYALYRLHLIDAAIQQLNILTKKTKDRPHELLLDIRYLRGQMFEELGQYAKARKDYEAIYIKEPSYQDVAQKLNL
ncbi:MAG: DUF4236 domain-containing protein [Alkaliphilus sp.]|nr:DUF4236 domain-containing protein [Alkaliphilus sp.]